MKEGCPVSAICSDWRKHFSRHIEIYKNEKGIEKTRTIEEDCGFLGKKCPNTPKEWEEQMTRHLERLKK